MWLHHTNVISFLHQFLARIDFFQEQIQQKYYRIIALFKLLSLILLFILFVLNVIYTNNFFQLNYIRNGQSGK